MTRHEELAADDGPAVEPDVRSIEDIAMQAGAMVVEGDLERVHEWAEAARERLSELGHPDAVLAIRGIENVIATREALQRAPTELTRNRIRKRWQGSGCHR